MMRIKCVPTTPVCRAAGTAIYQREQVRINRLTTSINRAIAAIVPATLTLISIFFLVFITEYLKRVSKLRDLKVSYLYPAPIKCGWVGATSRICPSFSEVSSDHLPSAVGTMPLHQGASNYRQSAALLRATGGLINPTIYIISQIKRALKSLVEVCQ